MNFKVIISIGLFLTSIISSAQSNGIRKIDAFFSEHQPGNIRADENGNPINHGPDTINTIYLETKGVTIKWIGAWKNGKSYSVITTAIKENPFEAGINKITDKKIMLRPATGNKLSMLQLEKNETRSKPPVKAKTGEIILQGKLNGKTIIQRIEKQIELDSMPSV